MADAPVNDLSGFHLRLQSLRGAAAMAVALGHGLTIVERLQVYDWDTLQRTNVTAFLLQLVFQADTAVIFFFVLSGFVLGQSIRSIPAVGTAQTLWSFACKRFGRLLPIYWLSIAVVFAYLVLWPRLGFAFASGWYNQLFPAAPSLQLLALNFLGTDTTINPILWSIQVEFAMIPLVLLLTWLADRTPLTINGVIIVITLAVNCLNVLPRCLSYIFCFHLGILLPALANQAPLARWLVRPGWMAMALAGFFVAEAIFRLGLMPLSPWVNHQIKYLVDSLLSQVVIINALRGPNSFLSRTLDQKPMIGAGNLSYGFYAFQLVCMDVVARSCLNAWPGAATLGALGATTLCLVIAVVSSAGSFAIAAFLHPTIELPGIRWGRTLSKRAMLAAVSHPM